MLPELLLHLSRSCRRGVTLGDDIPSLRNRDVGGWGVVFKAEDTRLKRTVALKFLPPDLIHMPEVKTRLMHEAQVAAALDHPNITGSTPSYYVT
jgi:serine/threonine protein kinase